MDLMIEKANEHDIDELEALYDKINDYLEHNINYPGWKKGIYPVRKDAEDGIKGGHLYVARSNNQIIGTIILSHEPEKGYDTAAWKVDADNDMVYIIHTLVVHPGYLKKQVGRRLMEFAEEAAKRDHMKALRLDVYEHNTPAIKLYQNFGYQYIGKADLGYASYGLAWFDMYEKSIGCDEQ